MPPNRQTRQQQIAREERLERQEKVTQPKATGAAKTDQKPHAKVSQPRPGRPAPPATGVPGPLGTRTPLIRPVTVEQRMMAANNPLIQDMLLAWSHEGVVKPKQFARYGWQKAQTAEADRFVAGLPVQQTNTMSGDLSVLLRQKLEQQLATTPSEVIADYLDDRLKSLDVDVQNAMTDPVQYARLLTEIFGYRIDLEGDFTDEQRVGQLNRLAEANLLIVQYFDGLGLSGIDVFRSYFSRSGGQQVTVYLGSDGAITDKPNPEDPNDIGGAGGKYFGYVPLPASLPEGQMDENFRLKKLSAIMLGSEVTTAAIIHEFFHQLDRHFVQEPSVGDGTDASNVMSFKEYLDNAVVNSLTGQVGGLAFTSEKILVGRANDSRDPSELFADYGMTAVVDASGGTFYAQADGTGLVRFQDEFANARDIRCALRQYFSQLISGNTANMTYDSSLCPQE